VKLIKILRKNPSIGVGDLNQQLNQCLSKLAFKRVRKAKGTFRALVEKVLPHRRKRLTQKYMEQGLFDFRPQTARFGSLYPLRLDDQFIIQRAVQGPFSTPVSLSPRRGSDGYGRKWDFVRAKRTRKSKEGQKQSD